MTEGEIDGFVCGHCGCGSAHMNRVRSAFWDRDRLVVIDDIPALVCDGCGEPYYDDATTVGIDLMRGRGFPESGARAELRVPVFTFGEIVPGGR